MKRNREAIIKLFDDALGLSPVTADKHTANRVLRPDSARPVVPREKNRHCHRDGGTKRAVYVRSEGAVV